MILDYFTLRKFYVSRRIEKSDFMKNAGSKMDWTEVAISYRSAIVKSGPSLEGYAPPLLSKFRDFVLL